MSDIPWYPTVIPPPKHRPPCQGGLYPLRVDNNVVRLDMPDWQAPMAATVIDALKAARQRLATPDKWAQVSAYQDAFGAPVPFYLGQQTRCCLVAALLLVVERGEVFEAAIAALREIAGTHPAMFNEVNSHATVIELLDRAIAVGSSR